MEKSDDICDCLVKFMHPEGQSQSFHWPQKDNIFWVEMESILKAIQPLTTGAGHHNILHENTQKSIIKLLGGGIKERGKKRKKKKKKKK
jgi:hypothetical protein